MIVASLMGQHGFGQLQQPAVFATTYQDVHGERRAPWCGAHHAEVVNPQLVIYTLRNCQGDTLHTKYARAWLLRSCAARRVERSWPSMPGNSRPSEEQECYLQTITPRYSSAVPWPPLTPRVYTSNRQDWPIVHHIRTMEKSGVAHTKVWRACVW